MTTLTHSYPFAARHALRAVFLSFGFVILYVIILAMVARNYDIALPFNTSHGLANVVHAAQPKPDTAAPSRYDAKGWVYDFSTLPDGPVSPRDWNFSIGTKDSNYNNEAQAYTDRQSNVRIANGNLLIEARRENMYGKTYTSARINTLDKFAFTYGTMEVVMKLPEGRGTWPAAWLMPSQNIYKAEDYGIKQNDPFAWSLNGEIDFAEAIGSIPGENIPAVHSYNREHKAPVYTPAYITNPYGAYHTYGVIKKPGSITFTLDGKPYATRTRTSDNVKDWPFEQPYYLILNLAIGGKWAGDKGIDDTKAPWNLNIQSISYSPLSGE